MSNELKKIYFIEVLRGSSSLLVVAYHVAGVLMGAYSFWPAMGIDLFRNGNAGVDIFFMISGFIICFATNEKRPGFRCDFVVRRFFRIYPLFFVCLSIAWLTYNYRYPLSQYLFSATLMLNDYSGKAPFFGYNMLYPAWTIAYEVIFYFLFFIAMSINHKHRVFISSAIIIFSMISVQLLFKGEISLYGGFSSYSVSMGVLTPVFTMLGSPMMLEFVFGMVFYLIYSNIKILKINTISYSLIVITIISASMLCIASTKMHGVTEKGMVSAAIFFPFMMSEMSGFYVASRITKFLSDISYSLYLTHAIVLKYYMYILKHFGFSDYPKGLLSFAFIFSICIAVAFIAHISVERPCINLGKKLLAMATIKPKASNNAF